MADTKEVDEKQRAFYTILAGAILIDRKMRLLERVELDALTLRCRTLSKLPESSRDTLRTDIVSKLRKCFESDATKYDRISEACDALVKLDTTPDMPLRRSVMLHALDLAHADDHLTKRKRDKQTGLHETEAEFFRKLASMLKLEWHAEHTDEQLIRLKNSL